MSDSLQCIIEDLKAKRWDTDPFDRAVALAMRTPDEIPFMVRSLVEQVSSSMNPIESMISFMPLPYFPDVVRHTLEAKMRNPQNEAVDDVILPASLQAVAVLHPHLTQIFDLRPNAESFYEMWPWRESEVQQYDNLSRIIERVEAPMETRRRAWRALLETRHPQMLSYAASTFDSIQFEYRNPFQDYSHLVGFHFADGEFHRLYHEEPVHHILFPQIYAHYWEHPTYQMQGGVASTARFGGMTVGICSVCRGDPLDHILTVDPLAVGMQVTGLRNLSFATCLSCLGWEQEIMYYQHDPAGQPKSIGYDGRIIDPQFPASPFSEVEVRITRTLPRWRRQRWNSENLHRIGGHPVWIQSADYPACPQCQQVMHFLFQLDSSVERDWMWGSGGICYVFWCDLCKTSAFLWQCT